MPGVSNAGVFLPTVATNPYDVQTLPTASVTVQMRDNVKPDRKLAYGIAGLVRGAKPGLEYSRINLIFDGHPFHLDDRAGLAGGGGGELLDASRKPSASTNRR